MSVKKRFKDLLYFGPRFLLVSVFMSLIVLMVLGNFDLLEPYLYPLHAVRAPVVQYGSTVTIGHYPHQYELERLKRERGVEIDLSLLDDDLPQEKALNQLLVKRTEELGVGFKNIPLNYFDLHGEENRARLAELVSFLKANRSRKIYIHCYLGRHRVKAVHDELVRQGLIPNEGWPQGR